VLANQETGNPINIDPAEENENHESPGALQKIGILLYFEHFLNNHNELFVAGVAGW
jgi:hypothetical protein